MVPAARTRFATLVVTALALACDAPGAAREPQPKENGEIMPLPSVTPSAVPLDEALRRRRTVRSISAREVSREHVGQLCWAAQGITEPELGLRTTPSAGALYPLELYVLLPTGAFHYEPRGHRLERVDGVDRRAALARGALGQDAVRLAGVDIVVTGVMARTRAKYGARAERYVYLEAGHAAQNVLLEATALGLVAVPIGAFDEDAVRRAIGVSNEHVPLYILALGHPE